jgi:predicted nucleotidyltransferase
MNIYTLLETKREDILRIASTHGAYNVRIFGSVARGEATDQSDVDLLVDVGPNRSFFFPGGLLRDLETLLGRHVDIVTENGLKSNIRNDVLKEAKPL